METGPIANPQSFIDATEAFPSRADLVGTA